MSNQETKIKRIAIFIAISDYTDTENFDNRHLKGIENDIQELTKLIRPAFDGVFTFTNKKMGCIGPKHTPKPVKSFEDIKSFLEEPHKNINIKTESSNYLIWIHFSGHGFSKDGKWILSVTGDKYTGTNREIFSVEYIINWINKHFNKDQQRVLVTISACQNKIAMSPSINSSTNSGEPIETQNGTCLIGSSPIGYTTSLIGSRLSEFVDTILKSIRLLTKSEELKGEYITIGDFIDKITKESPVFQLNISNHVRGIPFLKRSDLMSVIEGKYDYILINVGFGRDLKIDEFHSSYSEARNSRSWNENDLKRETLSGIVSSFKTDSSRPLIIYWRGKMRSVGFHLYLNEKESINLNDFVTIIKEARAGNIAIWIESEQAIRCDAERLAAKLPGSSYVIIAKQRDGEHFQKLREHHQEVIKQIESGKDLGTILSTNQDNVIIEATTPT